MMRVPAQKLQGGQRRKQHEGQEGHKERARLEQGGHRKRTMALHASLWVQGIHQRGCPREAQRNRRRDMSQ